jgi:bifunctional DNase/RNase
MAFAVRVKAPIFATEKVLDYIGHARMSLEDPEEDRPKIKKRTTRDAN